MFRLTSALTFQESIPLQASNLTEPLAEFLTAVRRYLSGWSRCTRPKTDAVTSRWVYRTCG